MAGKIPSEKDGISSCQSFHAYEPKYEMSEDSSENQPLLVADGDGEATPNYPRSSRRRVIRDSLAILFLIILSLTLMIFLALTKPAHNSSVLLEDLRKLYDIPSLAAAAVRNGSFYVQVTGVRKYDDPTLVRKEDIWHLGSNTKAMTGTLLALLIEDGLLTWDMTLSEALPKLKTNAHGNTTLAMIGAHRGGFSEVWTNITPALYSASTMDGREMIAELTLESPPVFVPGSEYEYSNAGYILLGYIMEQVTGKIWDDLIRDRIFEPLGMTSGCRIGVSLDVSIPPTNPWPHYYMTNSSVIPLAPDKYGDYPLAIGPAGLAHCSLSSYSKFLMFHLDGYKGRSSTSKEISLSRESFERLHRPWPGHWYTSGGWVADKEEGVGRTLWHKGSNHLNLLYAIITPDVEGAFISASNIWAPNATADVMKALVGRELLA